MGMQFLLAKFCEHLTHVFPFAGRDKVLDPKLVYHFLEGKAGQFEKERINILYPSFTIQPGYDKTEILKYSPQT